MKVMIDLDIAPSDEELFADCYWVCRKYLEKEREKNGDVVRTEPAGQVGR